jgi:hypothetical protein
MDDISDYIQKRPKNITLAVICVLILKPLIHYLVLPIGEPNLSYWLMAGGGSHFSYYVTDGFFEEVGLFLAATAIVCLIAWFFNDKIKAK